jgi:hypothetical protein
MLQKWDSIFVVAINLLVFSGSKSIINNRSMQLVESLMGMCEDGCSLTVLDIEPDKFTVNCKKQYVSCRSF